jgi:hypothetical protein
MKYLQWRNLSLYCSYPVEGWPDKYRLKVFASRKSERPTIERNVGLPILHEIQQASVDAAIKAKLETKLFDKQNPHEAPEKRRMTYLRHAARYWHYRLKKTISGPSMKFFLMESIKEFGHRFADEITPVEISDWLGRLRAQGKAVNTINNIFRPMCSVYNFACGTSRRGLLVEFNPRRKITYNPTAELSLVPGGKQRKFLLTPDRFERNINWLSERNESLAQLYLLCWETDCRPLEGASYRIEWIDWQEQGIDIPPEVTKGNESAWIPLSDRLMDQIVKGIGTRKTGHIFVNEIGNPWLYYNESGKLINNTFRYFKELRAVFPDAGVFRDTRRGRFTLNADTHGLGMALKFSRHKSDCWRKYYEADRESMRAAVGATRKYSNVVMFKTA